MMTKTRTAAKASKRTALTRFRAISGFAFLAILSSATPPSAHPLNEVAPAMPATAPAPRPASVATPLPAAANGSAVLPGASSAPATARPATMADFAVKTQLGVDHWLRSGEYVWDDEGVPPGPMRIVVDLEARQLHAYRGGVEIGRASIMYGDDEKPTPTGIFPILQKSKDHVSNLYGAPMPYMLRLTWDGISIHSSNVRNEYATHGCVGIPDEFAALLFAKAKLGDSVLVTNRWIRYNHAA
jgi:lipoprotein-anchoring transpeptidase ErfK/SrfK